MEKVKLPENAKFYLSKSDSGETFIATNENECLVAFIPETGFSHVWKHETPYKKSDGELLQEITTAQFISGLYRAKYEVEPYE